MAENTEDTEKLTIEQKFLRMQKDVPFEKRRIWVKEGSGKDSKTDETYTFVKMQFHDWNGLSERWPVSISPKEAKGMLDAIEVHGVDGLIASLKFLAQLYRPKK